MGPLIPILLIALVLAVRSAFAAEGPNLLAMGLEELMRVEVVSVARAPQPLDRAPAAVYVITAEDIRRSGATSVAELLREVPGMDVARVDGTTWAVGARGFAERYAGTLLVLVDGRSVYSPVFAGVYWDQQDLLLADIQRIEVIRGPGGALWGANAVNGVVNIITRDAADTVGTYAQAGAGNRVWGSFAVRQGSQVGARSYLRVYAKSLAQRAFEPALGVAPHDAWRSLRGGFRWDRHDAGALSVQGEVQGARLDQTMRLASLAPPATVPTADRAEVTGGHLLADWRPRPAWGQWEVKAYVDQSGRDDGSGSERTLTHDLELQHDFALGGRHRITWGGDLRRVSTHLGPTFDLSVVPDARRAWQWGIFAQDRVALAEPLELTLGAKVERPFLGAAEFQPSGRLLWRPTERHTLWAAVSRAVQVPALVEVDGRFNTAATPGTPPTLVSLLGGGDASGRARVLAFESGYRGRPADRLSLDLAGFFNLYEGLSTLEPEAPFLEADPAPTHLTVPLRFNHRMRGETYGTELVVKWQATDRVRLRAAYAWLKMTLHLDPGSGDTQTEALREGGSPQQQARLSARVNLPRRWELDTSLALTDGRPGMGVPAYARLDLRLEWTPVPGVSLSLTGQNLIEARHREFGNDLPDPMVTAIPRTLFARLTWER